VLLGGLILSFIMAFNIGGNDAVNPVDCAVGSGVLSIRRALILFSLFTFTGSLLQGFMVMKTIGKGIVPEVDVLGAFIIVLSANIWILTCTLLGKPISTTHSIISAVLGYGLVKYGLNINTHVLVTVILSWITSPLCSLILAFIIYKMLETSIRRSRFSTSLVFEDIIKSLLIFSFCFSAYAFGANDVGNATGVYVTIASKLGNMPDYNAMILLAAYGAIGIVIGGFVIGSRVIKTVAFEVCRLDVLTGLAAELSNALVVYLFTTIPYMLIGYGLPISTSYATVGSIIGAGIAKSRRSINRTVTISIAMFWVLTVPITATLCGLIYFISSIIIS
jgi:PiT family inorganic phosphate transporter